MNKFGGLFVFALGAAIGVAATREYFKKKYESISQEEIYAVREFYNKKRNEEQANKEDEEDKVYGDENSKVELVDMDSLKGDVDDYVETIEKLRYTNEESKKVGPKPYVISPDEFGNSEDDYTCISLSYYEDQVLADDADHIVEDIENVVGIESLTHFGEYEEDCVYVRNDRRKCDYEILLRQEKYSDLLKRKPYLREVKK